MWTFKKSTVVTSPFEHTPSPQCHHYSLLLGIPLCLLPPGDVLFYGPLTTIMSMLNVGLSPTKKIYFICCNESPLKVMKNDFYFNLKALFVPKIFTLFSWVFDHIEKEYAWIERHFKITHVPTWWTVTIHILLMMSWIKGNQTMKFCKLIEYNRNINL